MPTKGKGYESIRGSSMSLYLQDMGFTTIAAERACELHMTVNDFKPMNVHFFPALSLTRLLEF